MIGRELLIKGLGWALGSGHDVGLWSESWLSTSEPLAPVGPPTEASQSWKVSDLIVPGTNEWDTTRVRNTLPLYEEKIYSLIPSSTP